MMAHRRVLNDKSLLYLFSFDVEADVEQQRLGSVNGGVRTNIQARPNLSRVYHILRDRTIAGLDVPAVSGVVHWGGDWLYWREDDVGISDVRFRIQTDDGALIHGKYPVVCYLGSGGFRQLVTRRKKLGTEEEPAELPLVTTPRFQTTSATYSWIEGLQCLGFGRLQVIRGEFRRITYDIYSLT